MLVGGNDKVVKKWNEFKEKSNHPVCFGKWVVTGDPDLSDASGGNISGNQAIVWKLPRIDGDVPVSEYLARFLDTQKCHREMVDEVDAWLQKSKCAETLRALLLQGVQTLRIAPPPRASKAGGMFFAAGLNAKTCSGHFMQPYLLSPNARPPKRLSWAFVLQYALMFRKFASLTEGCFKR